MRRVVYTCLFGYSEILQDFDYERDGIDSSVSRTILNCVRTFGRSSLYRANCSIRHAPRKGSRRWLTSFFRNTTGVCTSTTPFD